MDTRYFDIIRRWWWFLILAIGTAAGVTYWIGQNQPTFYEAKARLVVGPGIDSLNPDSSDLRTGGQLMQTYAELATTRPVMETIITDLGLTTLPDILARGIEVRATAETQFLDISVQDASAEQAAAIANAVARSLVRMSPSGNNDSEAVQLRERMRGQAASIEGNIAEIESRIVQLEQQLQVTEDLQVRNLVLEQLSQERSRLANANQTLGLLFDSLQKSTTNQVRIVESAILGDAIASQLPLQVLLGALAGFILSAGIVVAYEFFDDATLKTGQALSKATGLPTLANIGRDNHEGLITLQNPRSPVSEAYRVLRTSIQFSSVDSPNKTLLVTSSIPQEGKTSTASNLATVIAQAGHNVLLIDTDLRRPSLHNVFDLPNRRGLTSLLLEYNATTDDQDALVNTVIHRTHVEGLNLLTSGPVPPNPSELLGSAKMRMFLDSLAESYDFIIMDSPAVLTATDAAILSAFANATLMIARAGKTQKTYVDQALEKLQDVNANIIGFALNAVDPKTGGYDLYYFGDNAYDVDKGGSKPRTGIMGRFRQIFARNPQKQLVPDSTLEQ
ncbi:MAG: polysaccharide biosynthesis tyrosine autokinase [Chloroflexota bacterium]